MCTRFALAARVMALAALFVCGEGGVAQDVPLAVGVDSAQSVLDPVAGPGSGLLLDGPEVWAGFGVFRGSNYGPLGPDLAQEYQEDEPGSFMFGVLVGAIVGKLVATQSEYYDAELLYVPLGALVGGVIFWTAGFDFPDQS